MTIAEFADDPGRRRVPIAALRVLADPTVDWPWTAIAPDRPMTLAEAHSRTPRREPLTDIEMHSVSPDPHLDRIAHFVTSGWDEPVELDIGTPFAGGWWPVVDGNHRLYAAIIRGDDHVDVTMSGDTARANEILLPDRPW